MGRLERMYTYGLFDVLMDRFFRLRGGFQLTRTGRPKIMDGSDYYYRCRCSFIVGWVAVFVEEPGKIRSVVVISGPV